MFVFIKPPDWNELSLSKKIEYYMVQLNKDHSYYVDKLIAKSIVKHVLGDEIEVPRTVRILENYLDVRESDINTNYIIKSAHASSWNLIIEEDKKYTIKEIQCKLSSWNCPFNANTEIQYQHLSPVFFIEEKITCRYQGNNGKAYTWCFYCANGKAFHINVIDKYTDKINRYDINFNLLDIKWNGLFEVNKPKELNKMIKMAEKLSEPFEFVRVDFYIGKDDKIYFSEFTFSPCMGVNIYDKYDMVLGKYWS